MPVLGSPSPSRGPGGFPHPAAGRLRAAPRGAWRGVVGWCAPPRLDPREASRFFATTTFGALYVGLLGSVPAGGDRGGRGPTRPLAASALIAPGSWPGARRLGLRHVRVPRRTALREALVHAAHLALGRRWEASWAAPWRPRSSARSWSRCWAALDHGPASASVSCGGAGRDPRVDAQAAAGCQVVGQLIPATGASSTGSTLPSRAGRVLLFVTTLHGSDAKRGAPRLDRLHRAPDRDVLTGDPSFRFLPRRREQRNALAEQARALRPADRGPGGRRRDRRAAPRRRRRAKSQNGEDALLALAPARTSEMSSSGVGAS